MIAKQYIINNAKTEHATMAQQVEHVLGKDGGYLIIRLF